MPGELISVDRDDRRACAAFVRGRLARRSARADRELPSRRGPAAPRGDAGGVGPDRDGVRLEGLRRSRPAGPDGAAGGGLSGAFSQPAAVLGRAPPVAAGRFAAPPSRRSAQPRGIPSAFPRALPGRAGVRRAAFGRGARPAGVCRSSPATRYSKNWDAAPWAWSTRPGIACWAAWWR